MPAPTRISADKVAWARYIANRRREVIRQLTLLPTLEQVAEELGCSKRYLEALISNKARMFHGKHR